MIADRCTRIHLARHGEVAEAWRGRVYGRLDVPLSDLGLEQSRLVGAALADVGLDRVWSSGLQRAARAAEAIADSCRLAPPTANSDFLELDRGRWAGLNREEIRAGEPDRWPTGSLAGWSDARGAFAAPGGETLAEVSARVVPALDGLARDHPGGSLAIVAHLWVLRAAAAHALGLPVERAAHLGLPPGGLVVLDWPADPGAEGRPRLVTLGPDRAALGAPNRPGSGT